MTESKLLSWLLNCPAEDIKKVKKTVYEWHGVYYEVVPSTNTTAPASHYINLGRYKGVVWKFRELGAKSALLNIKKNYEKT